MYLSKKINIQMLPKIHIHLISLTLSITIFSLLTAPMVTRAGELVVLIEGIRGLTVGTETIDFGSQIINVGDQIVSNVSFGDSGMIIDDMANEPASWSVTVSADNFADGVNTIPYQNISIIGDNDGIIEVTDGTSTIDGITVLSQYESFGGSDPQSEDITLISADRRNRTAEYTIHPEMQLTIPGGTLAGNYSNTLTITFLVN